MKTPLLKFCLILLFLNYTALHAQSFYNLNKGGTSQKGYTVSIPYEEVRSKVIVEAFINGKPHRFIVDTGAATTISQKLFNELHPDVLTRLPVTDQSGIVDSLAIASVQNIKLGNVTFNDIPSMVATEDMIFKCFNVDGLLGSNLFRNSVIQFSSVNHTFTVTDTPKPLNLKGKYAVKMDLSPNQSSPFIWVTASSDAVNGRDNPLFDSGMDGFYDLAMKHYKETFEPVKLFTVLARATGTFSFGMHGNALSSDTYKVLAPELKINKSTFTNVTTITTDGQSSRIGANIFKYGVVTVDYINKKFYFEPYAKEVTDMTEKNWPFIPTFQDGKLVVGILWDAKFADTIKPGDEIISFDGNSYQNIPLCDMVIGNHETTNTTTTLVLKDAATAAVKEIQVTKQ